MKTHVFSSRVARYIGGITVVAACASCQQGQWNTAWNTAPQPRASTPAYVSQPAAPVALSDGDAAEIAADRERSQAQIEDFIKRLSTDGHSDGNAGRVADAADRQNTSARPRSTTWGTPRDGLSQKIARSNGTTPTPAVPAHTTAGQTARTADSPRQAMAQSADTGNQLTGMPDSAAARNDQAVAGQRYVEVTDTSGPDMLFAGHENTANADNNSSSEAQPSRNTTMQSHTTGNESRPAAGPPRVTGISVERPVADVSRPYQRTSDGAGSSTTVAQANRGVEVSPPPATITRDEMSRVLGFVEAEAERRPADTRLQLALRLLYAVRGMEQEALSPIEGGDARQQQLVRWVVETVLSMQNGQSGDRSMRADAMLSALENLEQALKTDASLQIPKVILCNSVESFGVYREITGGFVAGRPRDVVVYTEVDNFNAEHTQDDRYRTQMAMDIVLIDPDGAETMRRNWPKIEDVSRNLRRDFYIPKVITLPASMMPGQHILRVTVRDLLGNKITQHQVPIRVVAQ